MSKIKSPLEKKQISLERDRRNVFGENDKSSRNAIRLGKQRNHMEERRCAKIQLLAAKGKSDDDSLIDAELKTTQSLRHSRLTGFKKKPDVPLKAVIQRKLKSKDD